MLNENQLSVVEAVSESEIFEKQAAPAYSVVYDGDVVGGGAAAEEEKSPVEGKAAGSSQRFKWGQGAARQLRQQESRK